MPPVIVGVADVKNRSSALADAKEPAQLMLEAINAAIQDASSSSEAFEALRSSIDSLDVVRTWTWPYSDLPALLSDRLGIAPAHKTYTEHGGNQPAKLLDDAALRIETGQNKVAVLTGGEALASLAACVKNKVPPPAWSPPAQSVEQVFSPTTRELRKDLGGLHSVGSPIHVYPLYENGFRAHRGQSMKKNHEESAQLYAHFSEIASRHPSSWTYGHAETVESIGTVSQENRMICLPYLLLMNAFNTVNLAAACVLTTTEFAKQLEIPEKKWIYPLSGAGYKDSDHFWERPNFFQAPAISKSLDQCLSTCGLDRDEIDLYDFYSCFPIVPKLACHHLGLSITEPAKPVTVLGGLTSFGGAGNNYSMHAITEMVRQLRRGSGRNGVILANGGVLSYQHAICVSSKPRRDGSPYPDSDAQRITGTVPGPAIDLEANGKATIETYTVEFSRNGSPQRAFVVGRKVNSNHRFVANHGDLATLECLASTSEEQIGKKGVVIPDPLGTEGQRKNLFYLDSTSRL